MPEISEVRSATARLAGLYSYGNTPSPETESAARRGLQVAKLDRAIRDAAVAAPPLDPVQTAHLVGLLLSWGGSDDGAVERLERTVLEAFDVVPGATAEDRKRITAHILASHHD